jgi:hypothetical protein
MSRLLQSHFFRCFYSPTAGARAADGGPGVYTRAPALQRSGGFNHATPTAAGRSLCACSASYMLAERTQLRAHYNL